MFRAWNLVNTTTTTTCGFATRRDSPVGCAFRFTGRSAIFRGMRALALAPSGLLARQGRPVHTAHGSSLRRAQVVSSACSSAPRSGPDAFRKRAWRWLSSRGPNSGDWLRVGPGPPPELGRARPPPWELRGCAWGALPVPPCHALAGSTRNPSPGKPRPEEEGRFCIVDCVPLYVVYSTTLRDQYDLLSRPPRVPARRPFFHSQSSWSCNLWEHEDDGRQHATALRAPSPRSNQMRRAHGSDRRLTWAPTPSQAPPPYQPPPPQQRESVLVLRQQEALAGGAMVDSTPQS